MKNPKKVKNRNKSNSLTKDRTSEKTRLHPLNKHRQRYDLKILINSNPILSDFIITNKYNDESVDFSDPNAVLALNKALLIHYYGITKWEIPSGYLCPPIPGRADYIHHMAELLSKINFGNIPYGSKIKCLDIGVGANCVYPIIGNHEYGWSFIGSDIDQVAIDSASSIVSFNKSLVGEVELRYQQNPYDIFNDIIKKEEFIDISICNPPFHSSKEEAEEATTRKLKNLNLNKEAKPKLNFGGQNNELWCKGGEIKFVKDMIIQSKKYESNCLWFSTLISKQNNLKKVYRELKNVEAKNVITIPMGQGNKTSRIIVWTFLTEDQQNVWVKTRWKS